ncbi:MAG: micrococcal nuclease [Candidatus Omnitrophota bacterium]|jgi:micrococcal nuclease
MKILSHLLLILSLSFAAHAAELTVRNVVDGDTLVLSDGKKVRLIGVDTPEIDDKYGRNLKTAQWTGIKPKIIRDYAFKAKDYVNDWVKNQAVRIEYDDRNIATKHQDKYGRALVYIYRTVDNAFLNADLIKYGYALTYRKFNFEHRSTFINLEKAAKQNTQGLWSNE